MRSAVLGLTLLVMLTANGASAACLGLNPPTPKNTNVCEVLLRDLVIPRTEVFCDLPWWARAALPHCNIPGACHLDPVCKSFEKTRQLEALIFNAGDLYCELREISPGDIIRQIGNQAYSDLVKLSTGGTSSMLYDIGNRHIDLMSCAGIQLKRQVKERLRCVLSKIGTANQNFSGVDMNRVTLVSVTNPTANLYLQDGYAAITLDDLVIMRDPPFQILKNWSKGKSESLTPDEEAAITLLAHELAHVRQYRAMGRETFLNSYLSEAIVQGYANISMEREANEVEGRFAPLVGVGCGVGAIAGPLREGLRATPVANRLKAQARLTVPRGIRVTKPKKTKKTNAALAEPVRKVQTIKPSLPLSVTSRTKPVAALKPTGPRACFQAVQDQIAWNHRGSKRWSPANVDRLCKGNERSVEPALCFESVLHKVKWPDGKRRDWRAGLSACAGTKDAVKTLGCLIRANKSGKDPKVVASDCNGA